MPTVLPTEKGFHDVKHIIEALLDADDADSEFDVISSFEERRSALLESDDCDILVVSTKPSDALQSPSSFPAAIGIMALFAVSVAGYFNRNLICAFLIPDRKNGRQANADQSRQATPKSAAPMEHHSHETSSHFPQQHEAASSQNHHHSQQSDQVLLFPTVPSMDSVQSLNSLSADTDVKDVIEDTSVLRKILSEAGEDPSLAFSWALRRKESRESINFEIRRERRRYQWDTLNRQQQDSTSNMRHEEVLNSLNKGNDDDQKIERMHDNIVHLIQRMAVEGILLSYSSWLFEPALESWLFDHSEQARGPLSLMIQILCECADKHSDAVSSGFNSHLEYGLSIHCIAGLWDDVLKSGACFGGCIVHFGGTVLITLVMHQILRALSGPRLVHDMINICFFFTLGYRRTIPATLKWFWVGLSITAAAVSIYVRHVCSCLIHACSQEAPRIRASKLAALKIIGRHLPMLRLVVIVAAACAAPTWKYGNGIIII